MNLSTPKHLTILVQALDKYKRDQKVVLEKLDPDSSEYENHSELILQIDLALNEVEKGYKELRHTYPGMPPLEELLGADAR